MKKYFLYFFIMMLTNCYSTNVDVITIVGFSSNYPIINKGKIQDVIKATTSDTFKGIIVKIYSDSIENTSIYFGIPYNGLNFNYAICFELYDHNGKKVWDAKTFQKQFNIHNNNQTQNNTTSDRCNHFLFLTKSKIQNITEGQYLLKTIFFEKRKNDEFIRNEYSTYFTLINNSSEIDSKFFIENISLAGRFFYDLFKIYKYPTKAIAKELLEKSITLENNFFFAYDALIEIYLLDRDYSNAIKLLDKWTTIRKNVLSPITNRPMKNALPISKENLTTILKETYPKTYNELIKKYFPEN